MKIKDRIEALFLASNRSLTLEDINELLNLNSKEDESEVINSIQQLQDEYKDKAYDLIEVSSGYRVQINHESSEDIAKLWEVKPQAFKSNFRNTFNNCLYATSYSWRH